MGIVDGSDGSSINGRNNNSRASQKDSNNN